MQCSNDSKRNYRSACWNAAQISALQQIQWLKTEKCRLSLNFWRFLMVQLNCTIKFCYLMWRLNSDYEIVWNQNIGGEKWKDDSLFWKFLINHLTWVMKEEQNYFRNYIIFVLTYYRSLFAKTFLRLNSIPRLACAELQCACFWTFTGSIFIILIKKERTVK